jgi:hypothetical protein
MVQGAGAGNRPDTIMFHRLMALKQAGKLKPSLLDGQPFHLNETRRPPRAETCTAEA